MKSMVDIKGFDSLIYFWTNAKFFSIDPVNSHMIGNMLTPEEVVEIEDLVEKIIEIAEEILPGRTFMCWKMFYLEEFEIDDIKEEMKMTSSEVRTRLVKTESIFKIYSWKFEKLL